MSGCARFLALGAWTVICLIIGAAMVTPCPSHALPLRSPEPTPTPTERPAYLRVIADDPAVIITAVRAPIDATGHVVGDPEPWGYVGANEPNRVLDLVAYPDHIGVVSCGFTLRAGVAYTSTEYLPAVLQHLPKARK